MTELAEHGALNNRDNNEKYDTRNIEQTSCCKLDLTIFLVPKFLHKTEVHPRPKL